MPQPNLVWLASYPKSGNTWFRAFLTALLGESEDLDLNGLKTNGIFSSRQIFDAFTDLDSTYLYDEEVKLLLPEVFTALSIEAEKTQYIKVHDAYTVNAREQPIIPSAVTRCALYIIRNPLDIAGSFANHMNSTIDHAIKLMNDPLGSLATQKNNHNTNPQLKQLMFNWSDHVKSWINQSAFPVHVIRYEDMLNDPVNTFTSAIKYIGLDCSPDNITKAIEATQFNKLQQKEKAAGFREKNHAANSFFRSGKSGNWINELTKQQAQSILDHHAEVMKQYGYDININEYYP